MFSIAEISYSQSSFVVWMLLFHAIPLSRNDTFQLFVVCWAASTPLISPAETTAVSQFRQVSDLGLRLSQEPIESLPRAQFFRDDTFKNKWQHHLDGNEQSWFDMFWCVSYSTCGSPTRVIVLCCWISQFLEVTCSCIVLPILHGMFTAVIWVCLKLDSPKLACLWWETWR